MPIIGTIASSRQVATPDTGAMFPLQVVTVGASASSVSFTNIPNTYKHLQIRAIARTTRAGNTGIDYIGMRFNSDSSAVYAYHFLYGSGSTVTAQAGTSSNIALGGNALRDGTANFIYGANIFDILDYANTNKFKTIRTLGGVGVNGATSQITFSSGLWRSTSAITSITLTPESDAWKQYSQFALYGILGA
jgi:hypothetical protein